MLKLNGEILQPGRFPDGTLLIKRVPPAEPEVTITWHYEDDRELVALIFLTKHLKNHGKTVHLELPYIPNARQDRVKSDEDVFTLKYFAEILNGSGFASVTVLDPHSNVSEALIDRIVVRKPQEHIRQVIDQISGATGQTPAMFYPDEGAGKRYSGQVPLPYAFGIKRRDWKTGQIQGLDVAGDTEAIRGRDVLIVDDICSRGGTFFFSAKRLKELGARDIYLYITHCEDTIFQGELLTGDLIAKIYTTNSILTGHHPKISVIEL